MDINEKIAQRRRELEAQRVVDAPKEVEIVQRAVHRNLVDADPMVSAGSPEQVVPDLQKRIDEETQKALYQIAIRRLTTGEKVKTSLLAFFGSVYFFFGPWWIGFPLLIWSGVYFDRKVKAHRFQMKVDKESIRVARETFSSKEAEVTQPMPDAATEIDGFKYAKKKLDEST